MVSIKDLAAQNNVTYEAVRQQVQRYTSELEGHIFVQGRTKYLDDYAVEFLNSKRDANPVVVYDVNKDSEIERLENENALLRMKLLEKQEKIEKLQDKLLEAAETPVLLLTAQNDLLATQAELSEAQEKIKVLSDELDEYKAKEENPAPEQEKEKRSWLYRLFYGDN